MIVNGNRVGFRVKVRRQLVRVLVHEDDVAVGHQLPGVVVVGVEVPRVTSISGVPRETVADTTLRFRRTRAAYTREAEPAKRPRPTSELLIVKEIEAVESTAILVVGPSVPMSHQ